MTHSLNPCVTSGHMLPGTVWREIHGIEEKAQAVIFDLETIPLRLFPASTLPVTHPSCKDILLLYLRQNNAYRAYNHYELSGRSRNSVDSQDKIFGSGDTKRQCLVSAIRDRGLHPRRTMLVGGSYAYGTAMDIANQLGCFPVLFTPQTHEIYDYDNDEYGTRFERVHVFDDAMKYVGTRDIADKTSCAVMDEDEWAQAYISRDHVHTYDDLLETIKGFHG